MALEIAVIGGGNGCYAAAADLAERGHAVRLWRRDGAALAPVRDLGRLQVLDHADRRDVALGLVTTDIAEALDGADLVLPLLPAFTQIDMARRMAPHLRDEQIVFLAPGTFGSIVMARVLREANNGPEVAFAEAGTLPWLARKRGPTTIAISARATRLPTGVFPAGAADAAFAILEEAFPAIVRLRDTLDAALMNAGPIIHPPLILMNAGPLEHMGKWDIHNEGTQPAIRRVTDALDGERIALRTALGYGPPHFPLADHYDPQRDEWMYGNAGHERLVDSGDWREAIDLVAHRYMTEDVVCGLSLLVSIADWAGVACPVARGLLAIGAAVVGKELPARGRSLESLGLGDLDRAAMARLLEQGFGA